VVSAPKGIPFKGQNFKYRSLTKNDGAFTADISFPIGWMLPQIPMSRWICYVKPFRLEMLLGGYMSGHAARNIKLGTRVLCGVPWPHGMSEMDKFPSPNLLPLPPRLKWARPR